MTYQGYAARIEYSEADCCFVGHIAGIRDVIGFHGESVTELRSAFMEAVDDYRETCQRLTQATATLSADSMFSCAGAVVQRLCQSPKW